MKILILANKPPYPPTDGGSIASMALIRGFARMGHNVTALSMNTRKHHVDPDSMPHELTSSINFHFTEVPAKISVFGLIKNLLFSKLPYNAQRFNAANFRDKLISLLNVQSFDLVQLEGLYLTPYITYIRNHSSALIAYRAHNLEHEIWQRTRQQSKGIKKLYLGILAKRIRQFEIHALNRYDLVVPITLRDFEHLNAMGNTKPGISIPAGVEDFKAYESYSPACNELFFIGALDWSPNQEGLLWFLDHCWPSILAERPETTLAIAGRNAPPWLVARFKRKNILYHGEVDDAQTFMLSNGIMIAPLFSGSGMRVKIIEGMSLGRVIVTTPIGCEGIEAINGKEILIEEDAPHFVSTLLHLFNNPTLQSVISDNSFKFVHRNYLNESLAERLIRFYQTYIP